MTCFCSRLVCVRCDTMCLCARRICICFGVICSWQEILCSVLECVSLSLREGCSNFWIHFGATLGAILGSVRGQDRAEMRQNTSRQGSRVLKSRNSSQTKNSENLTFFLRLLGPGASQKMSRWLLNLFNMSPEKLRELKKRGSQLEPMLITCWTNFAAMLGPDLDLKVDTKQRQRLNRKWKHKQITKAWVENESAVRCRFKCKSCFRNKRNG